jgi:long-chain acyl-CoA synthetase
MTTLFLQEFSMHPRAHASLTPDKPAAIMAATGEMLTFAQLESASNQAAHVMRRLGLKRGDTIATLFENELALYPVVWGAQRCGLYLTPISNKLSAPDIAYILDDSDARLLVASARLTQLAADALAQVPGIAGYATGSSQHGLHDWHSLAADCPTSPIEDESPGTDMLYSSGTTGRPKGVRAKLPDGPLDAETPVEVMGRTRYGMGSDTLYLSTSPLYHSAPLRWSLVTQRLGGTPVIMDKFDAERALALIDQYRISHTTMVPTHFVRMLKLPSKIRDRYDHATLRAVIHGAAPCAVPVKQAMIDWWGPIIEEYYSGTEQCGITALTSAEWLKKPGSVGRAILGTAKILDEQGSLLPPGQTGEVYFADGLTFEYYKDPEKTAAALSPEGWATLGDIGYLDEDGFLYLTDRKSFMIISGGVNIYPQEIENHLITHPAIEDVAVIGLPDEDLGEKVVAVVELPKHMEPSGDLEDELKRFARERLGGPKTPREFHFMQTLPREPTGKLIKRKLREDMLAQLRANEA